MSTPFSTVSETARKSDGKFLPGAAPGPGRPAGSQSGRASALAILDKMMGTEENKAKLAAALEKHFEDDPVRFFKTIIMPLLPSEAIHKIQNDVTRVEWVSLSQLYPPVKKVEAKSAD